MFEKLNHYARKFQVVLSELSFNKNLASYGLSQLVILLAGLTRIPLLAQEMSSNSIGIWLIWVNTLMWGPAICAGITNMARLSAQPGTRQSGQVIFSVKLFTALALLACLLLIYAPPMTTHVMMVGAAPVLATLAAMVALAPYFGFQQGLGKTHEQFIANATSSAIALLVTWAICTTQWWRTTAPPVQIFLMTTISCISMLGPYMWAGIRLRTRIDLKQLASTNHKSKGLFLESMAMLPPAVISGFDSLALVLVGDSGAVPSYGIMSRLYLLITVIPSAIYVQVFNRLSSNEASRPKEVLKLSGILLATNMPFMFIFILMSQPLARLMSHNKIEISNLQIETALCAALALPIWICISGAAMASRDLRRQMGRIILVMVLPFSVLATIACAYWLGAAGPLLASALTYALSVVAVHTLSKSSVASRSPIFLRISGGRIDK